MPEGTGESRDNSRYLLILGCSARKRFAKGKVAAWDLYDGVAFRVVKRLEREGRLPENVEILILSARYGLIGKRTKIDFYDQRMTPELARRQANRNCAFLRRLLKKRCYQEIFVVAGRTYLAAMTPFEAWLPSGVQLSVAGGGIGQKLRKMKSWVSKLNASSFLRKIKLCYRVTDVKCKLSSITARRKVE